ncbi:MAG: M1 family metallopeptidase [Bacteroidales bacterium]|nr:M1 family metallopeptidase [Bacteroidales bacterium]
MKNVVLILLVLSGIYFQLPAQHSHKCSHAASFQKSMLSDTLDAISYTIYINELDFTNQEITAQTDVLLTAKVDNLDEIKLELQDLTVDEVFVDGEEITGFNHSGIILTIPLDESINTGDQVTVSVFYHGEPFHEAWGGFHWSGQYAFNLGVGFESIPHNLGKTWFPCIDDFQDRATYELFVTVENGKDAVCGGLLESITDNGDGTKTYHWKMNQTIPTYLASVAVGDYARWTSEYNGIEADIPVEVWVKSPDSNKVDGSFENLNEILALFEDRFGPYRWDRVGYVGTAIGAMEHATNIAYPHFAINGNLSNESLLTHELSHMWFGDNVTCASAEEMWLNEGWAVFCDGLMQEELYGRDQYLEFINDMHKNVLQVCHTTGGDGSYFPLNEIPQEVTYGLSAYDRGATVVHSLRGYLGDDLFFDGMAAYNEEFKYNYASSYDLRDFLTGHTGVDMGPWFDNWVFHSGTPHYSVDSFQVIASGGEYDVSVFLKQKRHGPAFTGDANKIELTFMNDDWESFTSDVMFDGANGSATVQVPFEPAFIIPDFNELQCDAITDFSKVIKEPEDLSFDNTFFEIEVQSVNDSALVWVGHQWAPPDPLFEPVQGLTLSDYRYWDIQGVFPEGFEATGIFFYSVSSKLDDGLITNATDSVIMLYRPSPAYNWQYVDFTQIGLWNIGKLYVENIQPGQYTLAVCDDTFVGVGESKIKTGLNIFPNPSGSGFHLETEIPGTLSFYSVSGNLLESLRVNEKNSSVFWKPKNQTNGIILVEFKDDKNQLLAVERLVVVEN